MSVLAILVNMAVHAGMVSTCFPASVLQVLLGGCAKQVTNMYDGCWNRMYPTCLCLKPRKFQGCFFLGGGKLKIFELVTIVLGVNIIHVFIDFYIYSFFSEMIKRRSPWQNSLNFVFNRVFRCSTVAHAGHTNRGFKLSNSVENFQENKFETSFMIYTSEILT